MRRRAGATLIEVLVAIFVMGIGMLTLLALFPVGVFTMAQALQDERAAQIAINASSLASVLDLRHDPLFQAALVNPDPAVYEDAVLEGPSYPVYVDPIGSYNYPFPFNQYVGGMNFGGVPRRSLGVVTSRTDAIRLFTLLDEINFDIHGVPRTPPFERDSRFSWAYLMRRPRLASDSLVDLSVIVYFKRSLALNNLLQAGETPYKADFDPANNQIKLSWTTQPPLVRLGSWVYDNTPIRNAGNTKNIQPHSNFYRVVGVSELSANEMQIEVDRPIQGFPLPPPHAAFPFKGTIVVMEGVVEVFERGFGWQP